MTVHAGVRSERDAQLLRQEGIATLQPLLLDVAQPESIQAARAELELRCGPDGLRALINNAGINYVAPFELADETKVRNLMEVNVFGLINTTRALLPLLHRYAQQHPGQGRILNVGSIGSAFGLPWEFSYHASKFAVLGLSQSLRFELEPLGIWVSCVMPGGIRTRFFEKTRQSTDAAAVPPGIAHEAYYRRNLENVGQTVARFEGMGSEAGLVARRMESLILARRPGLRVLVGMDAKLFYFLIRWGLEGFLVRRAFMKR
jgi:NAD(P)-dependent dehydrogenase (short-subunit alcohol dehydrogenase family)